MAEGTAFLLPIAIDETSEAVALVPESFRRTQWTRLPRGVPNTLFVERVRALLERQRSPVEPTVAPAGATARTPPARPRRKWPLVAVVLAVVVGASLPFWRQRSPAPPAPVAAAVEKSIAVLPFTNMSDDKDNAYFADGVHEDILTNLANIGALKIISRTSVMQYRNTTKSIRQIASELQVAYVLEGSVRRAGNKIRVTGQLINARTDVHVWAKAYDRDLTDIFAIQAELSQEIASALKTVLSPRESKLLALRPTDNLEAYDLFLRARAVSMNGGNLRDRLAAAMPLLNRAVEIDPGFAAAWAQLAVFHAGAFISQIDPTEARLAQAREDLARARQLAPDSLEVVEAQRQVASLIGDNKTEAEQVRRMVELFPGKVESHSALAELAWEEKRWKDALDEFDQALALDPRGAATIESIRYANLGLRRYEQAEAMTRRLRELLPPALLRLFQFGLVSYWASGATGELDALLAKYSPEQKLSDPDVIIIQAQWLFMRGQSRELIQLWEKTGPKFRFSYTTGRFEKISIALALLKEGQPERARPLLEEERRRIEATLGNAKGTRTQQANLALTCALLGDATGADAAIAAGRNLPVVNLVDDGVMVAADAWLGRKDSAITAIAQAIRTPSVSPYFCNSHQIRYDLIWWPLQGDPRFQALIDDPKNNAPLF